MNAQFDRSKFDNWDYSEYYVNPNKSAQDSVGYHKISEEPLQSKKEDFVPLFLGDGFVDGYYVSLKADEVLSFKTNPSVPAKLKIGPHTTKPKNKPAIQRNYKRLYYQKIKPTGDTSSAPVRLHRAQWFSWAANEIVNGRTVYSIAGDISTLDRLSEVYDNKKYEVHHINGYLNRIDNLQLITTSRHDAIHKIERALAAGDEKKAMAIYYRSVKCGTFTDEDRSIQIQLGTKIFHYYVDETGRALCKKSGLIAEFGL